ncbi:uncharacterized protein [Aegilops tauschii subsp. strangulata]|uniref:uncharacterized protein isoform X2 n=1 Tax=Aegilops tauschii subsp. strangulata TaxID=200361 RepID=UPI00098B3921|nr:uncharacterized protein LOC109771652 isoform X1 [Aegilops tauschii subsp. strangulata]
MQTPALFMHNPHSQERRKHRRPRLPHTAVVQQDSSTPNDEQEMISAERQQVQNLFAKEMTIISWSTKKASILHPLISQLELGF